jgi:hypothetical protein
MLYNIRAFKGDVAYIFAESQTKPREFFNILSADRIASLELKAGIIDRYEIIQATRSGKVIYTSEQSLGQVPN